MPFCVKCFIHIIRTVICHVIISRHLSSLMSADTAHDVSPTAMRLTPVRLMPHQYLFQYDECFWSTINRSRWAWSVCKHHCRWWIWVTTIASPHMRIGKPAMMHLIWLAEYKTMIYLRAMMYESPMPPIYRAHYMTTMYAKIFEHMLRC